MTAPHETERAAANIALLQTLSHLLHRCQTVARMLEVEDDQSKRDLIDNLSLADLSVMRLLCDEGSDEIAL